MKGAFGRLSKNTALRKEGFGDIVSGPFREGPMRQFVLVAAAVAALAAASPSLAQNGLPAVIPSADRWVDIPTLAPAVTEPEMRARMNAEIVRAIADADGDQEAARRAIGDIVARYQELASPQGARMRTSPK